MSLNKDGKYEIEIIAERDETRYYERDVATPIKVITYTTPGLPRHTIWLRKDGLTEPKIEAFIRADIEQRLKARPERRKLRV